MGTQEELNFDKGSEAYAKLLAQEEREWHEQYDALIDRKIEIFDKLLQMHSAESYALIEKLVDDAMTENAAKWNTSYAWIIIFTQIYQAEKNAGEVWTLFDLADDLENLIAIMQPELLRNLVRISCLEPETVIDRLRKDIGLNL